MMNIVNIATSKKGWQREDHDSQPDSVSAQLKR
jgi:hypothetical protein